MCKHFSKIYSSVTTGPVEAVFPVESPWIEKTKVLSGGHGHMTKMAAVSTFDLLQNPKANTLETLYVGLGMQGLSVSLNYEPALTLA